ncbi:RHS repeat-associated core domain-containing protein [Aquimarina gracilis]|uniref:RHS repeat-associated core domain-containing protein n=1 Tax=Aquimarina gracilis TaxID=874422 RepID=A0ABU6A0W5_9FLAO|nr:RHS repeat-associated core domain-containing protein [Aquimarina gracilis]MEB3347731.1 RHS repeat-associated core domain-containing protein [Aquimarina gracilis]
MKALQRLLILSFLFLSFINVNAQTIDAGATTGELSVTPTGGANYKIPITVPPGVKDLVPRIGLQFNSQSANGLAGWGWNISGLSTITRVPSTTYHDGEIDPVDFDSKDRFALDGQRLLLKSGTYGADGSEYQTENFNNIKIRAYGGSGGSPGYFVVYMPNGTKIYYGFHGNSQGKLEWAISRMQDTQGNAIVYKYSVSGHLLKIDTITYKDNTITFSYKTRKRSEISHFAGQTFTRSHILDKIEVKGGNTLFREYRLEHDQTFLGYERLKTVQELNGKGSAFPKVLFDYKNTNGSDIGSIYNGARSIYPSANSKDNGVVSGDFDGDGSMDFVTYPTKTRNEVNLFNQFFNGTSNTTSAGSIIEFSNRFDDIITSTYMDENNKVLSGNSFTIIDEDYSRNSGTSQVRFKTFKRINNSWEQYQQVWNEVPTHVYYGEDHNGEPTTVSFTRDVKGKMINKYHDFVTASHRVYSSANVTYGVSEELTLKPGFHTTAGSTFHGKMDYRDRKKIPKEYISGDFNGDGIIDVLAIQKTYTVGLDCEISQDPLDQGYEEECYDIKKSDPKVYFINLNRAHTGNIGTFAGELQNSISSSYKYPISVGDFNGDGKSDLFQFGDKFLKIYSLNKANQLVLIESITDDYIKSETPILLGDYNGDGKTDFVLPTEDKSKIWRFFMSRGTDFYIYNKGITVTYQKSFATNDGSVNVGHIYAPFAEYHYIAQDYNQDGKTDIIKHVVATPLNSNDKSYSVVQTFKNILEENKTQPSFSNPGWIINTDKGYTKYGMPVFLGLKQSNSIQTYGYISEGRFFAYEFGKSNQDETELYRIRNNGLTQEITYGCIEDNDTYIPESNQQYPYINVNAASSFKLVNKITETASGIERSQDYTYGGAVSHAQGLGFLGFQTFVRSNWHGTDVSPIYNVSKSDPQLRGAITTQWTSLSSNPANSGNYITKSDYSYSYSLLGNKVYKVVPTEIEVDDNLKGISTTTNYTYDAYNNPLTVRTTFPGGSRSETYTYFHDTGTLNYHIGRLRKKVESSTIYGNTFSTTEEYDYENNLVSEIKRKGNNTDWLTETFSYDGFGNITSKTLSATGVTDRTESFQYDTSGRFMEKAIDIEGMESQYSYDGVTGYLLNDIDIHGRKTQYQYDGWGRVVRTTDYLGKITETSYTTSSNADAFLKISHNRSTHGQNTESYINHFGWEMKHSVYGLNGKLVSRKFEYDVAGKVRRESEPYSSAASQWTVTSYDEYSRPISKQLHTGRVVSTSYNGLSTTVDDGTKVTTRTLDAVGNIAQVTDPGGTINYKYHANGSMQSADYGGHKVTVDIDGWGRKTQLHDPSAGTYTYTYNILGELLQETTPKGTTNYTYDDYGKITNKKIDGENTSMMIDYAYNATTKLISGITAQDSFFDRSYTYTYEYDNAYQRPQKVIENTGEAVFEKSLTYDSNGRVNRETYKSSTHGQSSTVSVRNIYSSGGIRTEVLDNNSGQSLWKLVEDNDRGQALTIELGNGITKSREYDLYGLPKAISDVHNDTNAVALHTTYTFNAAKGVLDSRKNHEFNWQENFSYDSLDRLTGISGAVTKTQTYDSSGRIVDNSDIGTYAYQGSSKYQLKDITLNAGGDQYYEQHSPQEITYNAFKKPVDIHEAGNGRVSFEYSPMMSRSHAWYGGLQEDKLQRRYHKQYSSIIPAEIVHDTQDNSYKMITYIMGDAYSAPMAHIKKTGSQAINEYHYLHRDYLGSILGISNSAGEIVEQSQFGAWGKVDRFWAKNGTTAFGYESLLGRGFTGHEHFFSVGLIHMNGRMYDAQLGRFLSPDNYIQDPYNTQSFNRYGYVWNNPLIYNDPSGEIIGIIIGALVGAYLGGSAVNGTFNPGKWDWGSASTWIGIGVGAIIGGFSGGQIQAGNMSLLLGAGTSVKGVTIPLVNITINAGYAQLAALGGLAVFGGEIWGNDEVTIEDDAPANPLLEPSKPTASVYVDGNYDDWEIGWIGDPSTPEEEWAMGPITLGLTFELVLPEWTGCTTCGQGVSFGLVADITHIGWYYTEKTNRQGGYAFSVAPEISYVHGTQGNVNMDVLRGRGVSHGVGLGAYGLEFGTNGEVETPYMQISASGFGKGIDFGWATWEETNTSIYKLPVKVEPIRF